MGAQVGIQLTLILRVLFLIFYMVTTFEEENAFHVKCLQNGRQMQKAARDIGVGTKEE